jgi:hypothetical protein
MGPHHPANCKKGKHGPLLNLPTLESARGGNRMVPEIGSLPSWQREWSRLTSRHCRRDLYLVRVSLCTRCLLRRTANLQYARHAPVLSPVGVNFDTRICSAVDMSQECQVSHRRVGRLVIGTNDGSSRQPAASPNAYDKTALAVALLLCRLVEGSHNSLRSISCGAHVARVARYVPSPARPNGL